MLLCAVYCCRAQTSDQFSDGNFSTNPAWTGDDSLFQVNVSLQLQNKGSTAKDISLVTPVAHASEMEWQCWVRFNLSPSTSNFCRYYLSSDVSSVKGNVNGYYIQFGGATGNTDSITLYKQKGTKRTRIIAGRPATVAKSTNIVRIKVLRDSTGYWQLFSDTTGGFSFLPEGAGSDTEFASNAYTGVFVKYTSGNAQNYFFDDMYAGPKIIDTQPPRIDSLSVLSSTQLRLVFSEAIDAAAALLSGNYSINNGIGIPASADFENGTTNVIILELNTPLTNQSYELTATNMVDLNGNRVSPQHIPFIYYQYIVQQNDILISEFFPDPSPAIGLPEKEFVEIYNRSQTTINLAGWTISDGSTTSLLGNINIPPDSFLIVCAGSSVTDLSPFGKICVVTSLPSLNNSSDQIVLKDATGKMIHHIQYDLSWYADQTKQDGGFTIEMNNPNQLCLSKQNYAASDDANDGTPGQKNSRWSIEPDTTRPDINGIIIIDSSNLAVVFAKRMDSLSLAASDILLQGSTLRSRTVSSTHDTLFLQLDLPLHPNTSNHLSMSNATDCSGNKMNPASLTVTNFVPEKAHQFDVLINEIMADPEPPAHLPDAEYIELHNRSHKYISLHHWTISDATSMAILPSFMLPPESFVVITASLNYNKFPVSSAIIGVNGFPSLGNDADAITLKDETGKVIHHVVYSANAYRDNMKKNGGWSLELLDPKNPCGGDYNLTPSINSKGGTPGFTNSIKHTVADNIPPRLIKVYPLSTTQLQLQFNEQMDSLTLQPPTNYQSSLLPSLAANIKLVAPDYTKVILTSNDSFHYHTIYRLLIDSVKDCAGNSIEEHNWGEFGLPEIIDSGDIVINEILFDPRGDGSDFVEIVNRTDKVLDLKNIWLANTDDQNRIKDFHPIDSTGWLLFPQSFAVLTENPSFVSSAYFTPHPHRLIRTVLPDYSNDAGNCVLLHANGKRIDQLDYTDEMHYALLDNKDGVCLERIDWNRPSGDKSNWTSASSTSGFGTPTYQNSQYRNAQKSKDVLRVEPEVFSPDGDGLNDHVTFSYALPQEGYTGNVFIYNASGTQVKHLLRNELLGSTGSFGWDGFKDNGEKAAIGIYLYYFEAFNLKGDVIQTKSTLVVAARL